MVNGQRDLKPRLKCLLYRSIVEWQELLNVVPTTPPPLQDSNVSLIMALIVICYLIKVDPNSYHAAFVVVVFLVVVSGYRLVTRDWSLFP
jgi:hypothetical protein